MALDFQEMEIFQTGPNPNKSVTRKELSATLSALIRRFYVTITSLVSSPIYNRIKGFGTASAAVANTYVVVLSPVVTSLSIGDIILVTFATTNSGPITLDPIAGTAYSVKKQGTVALAAVDIDTTVIYQLLYDGTNLQITL